MKDKIWIRFKLIESDLKELVNQLHQLGSIEGSTNKFPQNWSTFPGGFTNQEEEEDL